MRALVTNDDGIDSPGLRALAEVARERGHDVTVAAPCWDSSGASASVTGVTSQDDILFERRHWPTWGPGGVLAVQATPALICRAALGGLFGPPPDVVLSGINKGANAGRAIIHSGTVGAALTAYLGHRPALAVSLAVPGEAETAACHWPTAAGVAGHIFDWLITQGRHLVINCNVPNVPARELLGIRAGSLAPVGTAQTAMTVPEGDLVPATVSGTRDARGEPGPAEQSPSRLAQATGDEALSDVALLARGYASITAVRPVEEDTTVDLGGAVASRPPWTQSGPGAGV